jgi:hypothetical protein
MKNNEYKSKAPNTIKGEKIGVQKIIGVAEGKQINENHDPSSSRPINMTMIGLCHLFIYCLERNDPCIDTWDEFNKIFSIPPKGVQSKEWAKLLKEINPYQLWLNHFRPRANSSIDPDKNLPCSESNDPGKYE